MPGSGSGNEMILIPSFEGIDFSKKEYMDFIFELKSIKGFRFEELRESAGGYPVYGFLMGDTEEKPVIYVDGGIHNTHEWTSSYWILNFMMSLSDPLTYFAGASEIINYLKAKYSFYILPVASPDSYVNKWRGANANGVNITENFDYNWEDTPFGGKLAKQRPKTFQ